MNATTHEARIAGLVVERKASTDVSSYAENALLSELPGFLFGVMTLVYIVTSFLALA